MYHCINFVSFYLTSLKCNKIQMNLPKLYSSSNSCVRLSISHILNKYSHLLKFKKNPSVLEIGTGDGTTTSETLLPILPENPKEIILSDKSKKMLEPAKTVQCLSKMQFAELDIEDKKMPPHFINRFDYIFSFFTFHWLKNTTTRYVIQNFYMHIVCTRFSSTNKKKIEFTR